MSPSLPRSLVLVLTATCALGGSGAAGVSMARADDASPLRTSIAGSRARERALATAVARLGRLERATANEVALLERRVAAAGVDLAAATALAERTGQRLGAAHRRVRRLRVRLAQVRAKLRALLVSRYTSDQPDLVTVVLNAHGFASLLETVEFLHRVQRSDTALLSLVGRARSGARRAELVLGRLTAQRRASEQTVERRRDALAGIASGLRRRRDLLTQARAARVNALQATRSDRVRAERALSRLLAERRRDARQVGPGGPWAIPWPIVQCESGGQNLPPNSASASGYYQVLDSTWAGLGGSTEHAYQASKAEQDRLVATLWAAGAGAHNWVCADLVGAV